MYKIIPITSKEAVRIPTSQKRRGKEAMKIPRAPKVDKSEMLMALLASAPSDLDKKSGQKSRNDIMDDLNPTDRAVLKKVLITAIDNNWYEVIVKVFSPRKLQFSDPINESGQTALHLAAMKGCLNTVGTLCHGIILKGACDFKETGGFQLFKQGEDISKETYIAMASILQSTPFLNDLNITDDQGRTALHLAGFHGKDKIIKLLLDHQANPDITDSKGTTYLQLREARYRIESMLEEQK